jgi:hypothetical protein
MIVSDYFLKYFTNLLKMSVGYLRSDLKMIYLGCLMVIMVLNPLFLGFLKSCQ